MRPAFVFTGRAAGDLGHGGRHVDPAALDPAVVARRAAVCPLPWTWLRQVHGSDVVVVREPGQHAGVAADAAVTATPGCAVAVLTADCAPVALVGEGGVVGVAHAGWRGLVAGVVERTVDAMRAEGAGRISATIGPCIHPECYEFGPADLDVVAARLGDGVRATTAAGRPALDLPAGVRAALASAGVEEVTTIDACTACEPARWYSHRARRERARQALVAWIDP